MGAKNWRYRGGVDLETSISDSLARLAVVRGRRCWGLGAITREWHWSCQGGNRYALDWDGNTALDNRQKCWKRV